MLDEGPMPGSVLGFLHTSPVHVPRFEGLIRELAPEVPVAHVVDPALLRDAQGADASGRLQARVREVLLELAQSPAPVVVCTCSTLGVLAERAGGIAVPGTPFQVMRVDRPMAEQAVEAGPRIGVFATLASALPPVRALLEDVARTAGRAIELREHFCEAAWPHFEAGDEEAYLERAARELPEAARGVDALVLAQASLEGALALVPGLSVPVFSSPRLGVEAAVRLYREATGFPG